VFEHIFSPITAAIAASYPLNIEWVNGRIDRERQSIGEQRDHPALKNFFDRRISGTSAHNMVLGSELR
jgi:hypothetical protein